MSLLVKDLLRAIISLLDRPFAFFGHSMGAMVAFELARHLQQAELPQPAVLFVSGCRAPHLSRFQPAIHSLPDHEFVEALQELNGMPDELLQLPEAMEMFLPVLRADFALVERYQYDSVGSPLKCRIRAFGGLDDPRVQPEMLESWSEHTDGGFKSQYFSGDHFFINTAKDSILACIASEITNSSSHVK
jgi:medium-chain acyl-[acyl-carrier-protein] hydrolase